MKTYLKRSILTSLAIMSVLNFTSCSEFLEEEVYTQYDPDSFLQDQEGVDALLTGVYASTEISGGDARNIYYALSEFPTDVSFETDGGFASQVKPIQEFNLNPSIPFISGAYSKFYAAIARANNVLLVTSGLQGIDADVVDKINAEARFLRAYSYYILHNFFGPTPIIEIPAGATIDEIETIGKETPRPTEADYRAYVEADLIFAATTLDPGTLSSRANKGSAYALLTKFYLSNREWQKAADAAAEVLKLDYELYNDYTTLFSIQGENNKEYIFRTECKVGSNQVNQYMPHAFPPRFRVQPNWVNFAAQFRTYTAFYETFEEQDERRKLFLTEYIPDNRTEPVQLVRDNNGNPLNNARSFKYTPDPDAQGVNHGNDIPVIRLADIILARAEALNEVNNGPTQEAIDLINRVRNRAKASPVTLNQFATMDALNDFILAERARELYTEGILRREDLIRHDKYISRAVERGFPAQPFHVLYPIPQDQLDSNPNLAQNPGY
ncbi:MAG: RagB/SusD family nutrient uptake outer membrane protein [Leeuwenhoekiella sp.]|nr:MAG: RagB/SusD family nutrient uptake outer membrane protein [Leeuwenhoekiella sp.]